MYLKLILLEIKSIIVESNILLSNIIFKFNSKLYVRYKRRGCVRIKHGI